MGVMVTIGVVPDRLGLQHELHIIVPFLFRFPSVLLLPDAINFFYLDAQTHTKNHRKKLGTLTQVVPYPHMNGKAKWLICDASDFSCSNKCYANRHASFLFPLWLLYARQSLTLAHLSATANRWTISRHAESIDWWQTVISMLSIVQISLWII